jgi:ketosteroid isomerase-like protein
MIKSIVRAKVLIVVSAFAVAATVIGFNFYAQVSAQTNEVKAVTDVLTKEAQAVEKGDLAVFESGHANYGWSDYRNTHLAPELKEFKNTKYSFSDLKVKVDGKTAWATFKYSLTADIGTRNIQSGGLGTAVLEKRDGRWQIVHWHSSAPRRAPSPTPTPKS